MEHKKRIAAMSVAAVPESESRMMMMLFTTNKYASHASKAVFL
jgi:hypothetical protein